MKIKFKYYSRGRGWPLGAAACLPDVAYEERGDHPYYIFTGPFNSTNCDLARCKDVLAKINMIESGELEQVDFSEESWCVDIRREAVEISFDQDWDYCAKYPLSQFKKALIGWIEFIQMPRELNSTLTLEL